jgi:hypothetical protein
MKRTLLALTLIGLTALTAACGDKEEEYGKALEEIFNEDGSIGSYDGGGDNGWASDNTDSYGNESDGYGYVCTGGECVDYGY